MCVCSLWLLFFLAITANLLKQCILKYMGFFFLRGFKLGFENHGISLVLVSTTTFLRLWQPWYVRQCFQNFVLHWCGLGSSHIVKHPALKNKSGNVFFVGQRCELSCIGLLCSEACWPRRMISGSEMNLLFPSLNCCSQISSFLVNYVIFAHVSADLVCWVSEICHWGMQLSLGRSLSHLAVQRSWIKPSLMTSDLAMKQNNCVVGAHCLTQCITWVSVHPSALCVDRWEPSHKRLNLMLAPLKKLWLAPPLWEALM